jgi:hypothetical protein
MLFIVSSPFFQIFQVLHRKTKTDFVCLVHNDDALVHAFILSSRAIPLLEPEDGAFLFGSFGLSRCFAFISHRVIRLCSFPSPPILISLCLN